MSSPMTSIQPEEGRAQEALCVKVMGTGATWVCNRPEWYHLHRDVENARAGTGHHHFMPPVEPEEGRAGAAERIARLFHETYERLAPSFGYETRKESAVPWADVPEQNRVLMVAVAREVEAALRADGGPAPVAPLDEYEDAQRRRLGWCERCKADDHSGHNVDAPRCDNDNAFSADCRCGWTPPAPVAVVLGGIEPKVSSVRCATCGSLSVVLGDGKGGYWCAEHGISSPAPVRDEDLPLFQIVDGDRIEQIRCSNCAAAEAERDRLRDKLDRIETLADDWSRMTWQPYVSPAVRLRAALEGQGNPQ